MKKERKRNREQKKNKKRKKKKNSEPNMQIFYQFQTEKNEMFHLTMFLSFCSIFDHLAFYIILVFLFSVVVFNENR